MDRHTAAVSRSLPRWQPTPTPTVSGWCSRRRARNVRAGRSPVAVATASIALILMNASSFQLYTNYIYALYSEPVRCGQTIRLRHYMTGKHLHSHTGFTSPLSGQQEVSGFAGEDDGECRQQCWMAEARLEKDRLIDCI